MAGEDHYQRWFCSRSSIRKNQSLRDSAMKNEALSGGVKGIWLVLRTAVALVASIRCLFGFYPLVLNVTGQLFVWYKIVLSVRQLG